MGEVYRATDERLVRDVAIKVLKPRYAHDQDRLRRFELEARSSAALSHPNIVAVYDVGMSDGEPYIVSEFLQGITLRQRFLEGPLPLRQVADYGSQIAQGLVAAHEKHIVHRDLKPENVFLTRDGRVKILDFGIAKLTTEEDDGDHSVETMVTQTRTGSVVGTVRYMSPEQLRAQRLDPRSDIFSVGAILYEMLTGKAAFSGDTQADTMMAVLSQDPPEMTLARQSVPVAFEQIVGHCLEKDPDNRFQSARDLVFALSTVSDVTSKQFTARWSRPKRYKKWLPWAAAAILLAVAGVLVGARFRPVPNPSYRRITFERGTVYSARFSPDGHNILYGASWNGRPLQLYSTVGDSPLAQPLDFGSANLLAISRGNDLAVVEHGTPDRRDFTGGVLARAPLAGGTPREILEDVRSADWNAQGELAVAHDLHGQSRLEFPIGKVLYQTSGWISDLRFSPDGKMIAFMDHPEAWDDRGSVCVVDLHGKKTTLAAGWVSENGLDWSPSGSEVWFTATPDGSTNRSLWAVDLKGKSRKILTVPGGFTLQDITQDGRVLATADTERLAMEWTGKDKQDVRDLSWYDWSVAKDISRDGKWVLFEESSEPAGPNSAVAIRNVDGSPPIRLGDGTVGGLSPDGQWAVSVFTGAPQHISLFPVGPGEARQISLPGLEHLESGQARFLPDGKHIVVNGNLPGRPGRTFLVALADGKFLPVTPEGVRAMLPSPDGKYLVGATPDGKLALFPVDGGAPVTIPNSKATPAYDVARWSGDGKALYVYQAGAPPLKIYRMDVATGRTTPLRELIPTDRAGVVRIGAVVTNPQGTEFAYSYLQALSVLYVIYGLR